MTPGTPGNVDAFQRRRGAGRTRRSGRWRSWRRRDRPPERPPGSLLLGVVGESRCAASRRPQRGRRRAATSAATSAAATSALLALPRAGRGEAPADRAGGPRRQPRCSWPWRTRPPRAIVSPWRAKKSAVVDSFGAASSNSAPPDLPAQPNEMWEIRRRARSAPWPTRTGRSAPRPPPTQRSQAARYSVSRSQRCRSCDVVRPQGERRQPVRKWEVDRLAVAKVGLGQRQDGDEARRTHSAGVPVGASKP